MEPLNVLLYVLIVLLVVVGVMRDDRQVDCREIVYFSETGRLSTIPILMRYHGDIITTVRSLAGVRGFDKTRLIVYGASDACGREFLDRNGIIMMNGDDVRDQSFSLLRAPGVIFVDSGAVFSQDMLEFFEDMIPSLTDRVQCVSAWNPHAHLLGEKDGGVRLSSENVGVVWMGTRGDPKTCIIPNVPRARGGRSSVDTERFFVNMAPIWHGRREKRRINYEDYIDGLVRAIENSHPVNDLSECGTHGSNVIWISTGGNGWSIIGLPRSNRGDFHGLIDVSRNGRRVFLIDITSDMWSRFHHVETHIFNVRELVSWRTRCSIQTVSSNES